MEDLVLSGLSILAVDDEEMLLELIVSELEFRGVQVKSATSVAQALDHLEKHRFDLVLSDICMPKVLGTELLNKIRENNEKKPVVVMITGFSETSLESLYDLGADAVLKKPFDFEVLFETICYLVKDSSARWSRQDSRLNTNSKIELSITGESLDSSIKAGVINIGRGGFFLAVDPIETQLKIGDKVQFRNASQSNEPSDFTATGIIRWVREIQNEDGPIGIGVEILYLEPKSLSIFESMLLAAKIKSFIPKK